MHRYILIACLALGASATSLAAASLGLATTTPTATAGSASLDYLTFGPDGDLSAFGAAVTSTDGLSVGAGAEFEFGLAYTLADPTNGPSGGFSLTDTTGVLLSGDVLALGFAEDTLEIQLNNLAGSRSLDFSATALLRVDFDDTLGADPLGSLLLNGSPYAASLTLANVASSAVIPLPAGLPLLASALGLAWGVRRRSNA